MAMQNSQDMVASSRTSRPNGKRPTTRTSKLTLEAALEILTQSFRLAEEAGVVLAVDTKDGKVLVSIDGVTMQRGILVPVTPLRQAAGEEVEG